MILATADANGSLCQGGENEMRKGNVKAINHNILKNIVNVSFATLYVRWDGWCNNNDAWWGRPTLCELAIAVHKRYASPTTEESSGRVWQFLKQQDLRYKHASGISADSPEFLSICSIGLHLALCSSVYLSVSLCRHSLHPCLSHAPSPSLYFLTFLLLTLFLISSLLLFPTHILHFCHFSHTLLPLSPFLICVSHFLFSPLSSFSPILPLLSLPGWWVIHLARH